MYRIRLVDGHDPDTASTIHRLHELVFRDTAPAVNPDLGWWWLAYLEGEPVGFAGMAEASSTPRAIYLNRAGVLEAHRGHRLQLRMIKAREARARLNNYAACVTDTTDNVASANTLIRAGYRLYVPSWPWSFEHALYWKKDLTYVEKLRAD